MRKLSIFSFALLLVFGCKDNNGDGGNTGGGTYPTDNLDLSEQVRSLLITNYGPSDQGSLGFEVIRLRNESTFRDDLNHMSLVSAQGHPLYSITADSIRTNFLSLLAPSFVVDYQNVSPANLEEAVDAELNKKPILAVAHKVSENDTAWIVDNKVKFFKDTASSGIFIQTYLLAKIKAQDYGTVNLNAAIVNNLTKKVDDATIWDLTVPNLDTSANAITTGDDYYHQWVMVQGFNPVNTWGVQLATYWPFGADFYKKDVIGTRDTPIRHFFLKPKKGTIPYDIEPQFLTVVWILNPFTGNWEYLNSYQTN